jgi:hypothetical protein
MAIEQSNHAGRTCSGDKSGRGSIGEFDFHSLARTKCSAPYNQG